MNKDIAKEMWETIELNEDVTEIFTQEDNYGGRELIAKVFDKEYAKIIAMLPQLIDCIEEMHIELEPESESKINAIKLLKQMNIGW